MPSEYHAQHCRCRECRIPADRSWPVEFILAAIILALFSGFSVAVVALLEAIGGGAQ